ncbi:MAG: CCA tRNA nucleotidyltransferase [Lachnospiraceae bacterium]|nr:CCA tRNA nucleotidyltransferase [Lachnospiraceae bacterium]
MKIEIPTGAAYILQQLNQHGYEAYVVGGCVRDSLLGKQPHDWDITTSAKPEEVKRIFARTIDTGIQHGTVTVLVNRDILIAEDAGNVSHTDYAFEVTTYRVDGEYKDHRRPETVCFTASLEEDLKRRDFTINAMAYNPEQGVIDIFGGQEDLKRGIIRCVGCACERFDEDALRILRAVRFGAQLDFAIEDKTREAMRNQARFLKDISAERICTELTKMLVSDHPERLEEAYELGLTKVFLPEFDVMMQTPQNNQYHLYDVGHHTLKVMEAVPATTVLRYAALFHDIGKPECKTTDENGVDHFYGHPEASAKRAEIIMRRLKMDNDTIGQVCRLVRNHDYGLSGKGPGIKSFRKFIAQLGAEYFEDYLAIRKGDMAGQSDCNLEQRKYVIAHMQEMYTEIMEQNQCLKMSELAICGKDLIELGVKPGPDMGRILKELLNRVLDAPELNTREQLLAIVKESYL